MILNEEEKGFLAYWEANRLKKKKIRRNLSVGLPLAVAMTASMLISIYSGWHIATNEIRYSVSQMIIIIASIFLVIIFVVIFSARHRWDLNEQYYRELLAKKDRE